MLFKVIKSIQLGDIWTGLEVLHWKIQFCYTSFLPCMMLGSFLFYCILLCPRLVLHIMSMFSAPTDSCENPNFGTMARKKSPNITMKIPMFHVKNPWALRISGRYLYNKYIGVILCSFNMVKHLEPLPWGSVVFFQKNQFTVFSDLPHQPDLISTVVFVRKMEQRSSNTVCSAPNIVIQKCF